MKSLYALVGMKHRGTEALVASLPDGEPLRLVREADNKHDPFAVQVWAHEQHVGYVKATQVRPVAMAMDRAAYNEVEGSSPLLSAEIDSAPERPATLRITPDRWPMVEVQQ